MIGRDRDRDMCRTRRPYHGEDIRISSSFYKMAIQINGETVFLQSKIDSSLPILLT